MVGRADWWHSACCPEHMRCNVRARGFRSEAAFCALAIVSAGCTGILGGADADVDDDGPTHPQSFECSPGDPSPTVLPRLSRAQYLSALRDLSELALGPDVGSEVFDGLSTQLTLVPPDSNPDHARLDQSVTQDHVDGQYQVAITFSAALTADASRVEALVGSCAVDADQTNDAACLETFLRDFGRRAHRRPLSDAELTFYRDEVFAPATGVDPLAIRDVITVMVLSPFFLYRVENEGEMVRDRVLRLSPHELATRLSFHFWDAPPDAELLDAAESGALGTEEGYEAEVDRLLEDPRTRATFDRFFSEWLLLDDLAPLEQNLANPAYAAFVGEDVPTEELRQRVLEDTLDLIRFTAFDDGGSLRDLFLTDRSFAKTEDVAALYGGAPLWNEGEDPPPIGDGRRAGILTRPAMLATGSVSAHPVLRGREVRRRILCDDIPPPPADAMSGLVELDPLMGEQARIDAQTGSGSCGACHSLMNPIGFNLGAFDGLGRVRSFETVYGEDGSVLAEVPVNTVATTQIGDEPATLKDAVELSQEVVDSGKPQACFSRHYFRFAFGRSEDVDVDGCVVESMRAELEDGRPLREVLRDVALSETFRSKTLTQ